MIRNASYGRTGGAIALAMMAALLASCGGNTTADGNAVEMRDMEVVDGTTNDAMTDLDAVRSDGIGVGDNAGNGNASVPAATPNPKAEAVPSE